MRASKTMPAARFYGRADLRVEEVEVPPVGKGEVRVKVAYLGICGSDLHEVYGGPLTCCPTGQPHPLTGTTVPETLGHEFSGVIEEVGEGVDGTRLKVGQKVCIEPVMSCGTCEMCNKGNTPLCATRFALIGYNRAGGMAPYVNVPQRNVHVVPSHIPLDVAALAEPLSVAWHAVNCAQLQPGETALVCGSGPIGALVTRVLKARGCSTVFVSEPTSTRGKIATSCGADVVLNPLEVDVVAEIRKQTGGQGVHIAFDCAGNQHALDAAVEATRAKGRVVIVALWEKRATLDFFSLLSREKTITASCCFVKEDMEEVIAALAEGRIRVDDLITSRILLQNVVEDGLEALKNNPAQVKILVDLDASVAAWESQRV